LSSTFKPRSDELAREFDTAIADAELTKGPYLEASAPFESGVSVADLMAEGVLSPLFERMDPDVFPIDRPLYLHQELAIRKAVSGRRNIVVSTGTGSGKTETFLIPILDGLLREIEAGTIDQPGVRALLLYPMNALANDQVKRLRLLLRSFPEVTFGRYVGETTRDGSNAEAEFKARYPHEPRVSNELLSRDVIQETPPSILLTNYAMLEYLLLRPSDSSLFDGDTGSHWRTVVLDEAHIYDGATGTEVAMLMRRVRDRVVSSEAGRLQCFATSATLGRGEEDMPKLISFAESLFGENFDWDSEASGNRDIVSAVRRPLVIDEGRHGLAPDVFVELRDAFRSGATAAGLHQIVAAHLDSVDGPSSNESAPAYLGRVLAADRSVIEIQKALGVGAVPLRELASQVFDGPTADGQLVALVDLAVAARRSDADASVIPARYHFWVGSLEGGFLCLHPDHPDGNSRLVLGRHEHCPACAEAGLRSFTIELGVCRSCGAEYAVGKLESSGAGDRLVAVSDRETAPAYFLFDGRTVADADEDVVAFGYAGESVGESHSFDVTTGQIGPGEGTPGSTRVPVTHVKRADANAPLHRCARCSTSVSGEVVFRFLTGVDAPVSVVATELYQALPESSDVDQRGEPGAGRKLLSFADSRQDAAYFAPYLQRTYERSVTRGLIRNAAHELTRTAGPPRLPDVIQHVLSAAERALLVDPDDGRHANIAKVAGWVIQEAIAWDRRLSIDGLGLAEIRVVIPRKFRVPPVLDELGFSPDDAVDLLTVLLDTMRLNAGITMPEGLDIRDEQFSPRNREIRFRSEIAEYGIVAWLPGGASRNRRMEYLEKVLVARGLAADARQVLQEIWNALTDPTGPWSSVLVESQDKRSGTAWRLSYERIEVDPLGPDHSPYRCDACRRIWWRSLNKVCPSWRCDGTLEPVGAPEALFDNHYARLYRDLAPIAIEVKEHTAQWKSSVASSIQDKFMSGEINVLSCSTTFELGVDVGEVQAVLLRNVPPRAANYVQRAGRAGRRQDSAALVVAMAQRRAHDRYYFDDPTPMIEGVIAPPVIKLDNESILRRHVHSVAFAAFERHLVDNGDVAHGKVEEFFGENQTSPGVDAMRGWLDGHPEILADQLNRLLPGGMADALGVAGWGWVAALFDSSDDEPTFGWMGRATGEARETLGNLDEQIEDAFAEKNGRLGEMLKRMRKTVAGRQLLGFLASRNVLPKYGFPVDVVPLELSGDSSVVAGDLELDRDLRLAIGDYAPGSTVVAGGHLWRSEGLRRQRERELPVYKWRLCKECGAFRSKLGDPGVECPQCGSDHSSAGGDYVQPIFGFIGAHEGEPGDSRPSRNRRMRTWFGSYRDTTPDLSPVEELSEVIPVGARTSRQGRIVTINEGSGQGFRICAWCGRGEKPQPRGKRSSGDHADIRRPGKRCKGSFRVQSLGHDYLTDVAEIRIGGPHRRQGAESASRSLLYALLAGVSELGIARSDVDGTLQPTATGMPALVIFDTVAGGAGHSQLISERLPELFEAAWRVVSSCSCEETSSCYGCLRTYGNQYFHDDLSRGDARDMIEFVLGRKGDAQAWHGEFHPVIHDLIDAALDSGAELPVPGYETGCGVPVEAAWPDEKIAIWIESGDDVSAERTSWFVEQGWNARHAHDWTAAELVASLRAAHGLHM